MINKNQLSEIIRDLKSVVESEGLYGVLPTQIFEQACSYHRGLMIEQNRNSNTGKESNKSDKPTQKQIDYLKKHGVFIPGDLTKQEAKEMIGTYIKNLQKENI